MLFFSCASPAEARPLIRFLHLKRQMDVHRFELFRTDGAALIVTGTGAMEAAAAVSFFLTRLPERDGLFTHVRFGVAAGRTGLALCNRILSPDGRVFYPDLLFAHPFDEATEDAPEAAGAFRAASLFLPLHRVLAARAAVPVDDAEPKTALLCNWLQSLSENLPQPAPAFGPADADLLRQTAERLQLTEAMRLELERLALFRQLRGDGLEPLLSPGMAGPFGSLQERKKAFASLREKLLEF